MSLLVTYPPNEDESGFGYYRRLAADNILSGWRELARVAGVQSSRSALLGHTDFVAEQLGLEHEWADFASQQDLVCRSWSRLQRRQADAVCPACLAEEGYLRHHWEHTYPECFTNRLIPPSCSSGCVFFQPTDNPAPFFAHPNPLSKSIPLRVMLKFLR